jgi:hypothetical protein
MEIAYLKQKSEENERKRTKPKQCEHLNRAKVRCRNKVLFKGLCFWHIPDDINRVKSTKRISP